MTEHYENNCFEDQNAQFGSLEAQTKENDLLMEEILDNINTTPIGQVLKKIATLPEVRSDKVLNIRNRLTNGDYSLSERLDSVLDRVLEDLTA